MVLAALLVAWAIPTQIHHIKPTVSGDAGGSYLTVVWEQEDPFPEGVQFQLEETSSHTPRAEIRYQGPQTSSMISGLVDGEYHYRVRARTGDAEWSAPVTFKIEHHPLQLALLLFVLGGLNVVAIVAALFRMNRKAVKS